MNESPTWEQSAADISAQNEVLAQARDYRRMVHVGGRGYGKTAALEEMKAQAGVYLMANVADPAAPTVEELQAATRLTGVSEVSFQTPYDEPVTHLTKNFEAEFSFKSKVLGNWDWLYTPRDELRDRLNQRLKGEEPWSVINTRYWRGL